MDRLVRMSALFPGFAMVMLLLATATGAQARSWGGDVAVEVVDGGGGSFATYPLERRTGGEVYRAYLEAREEARYRIRVHNRSGGRVGVVIAVDGRNIISGARSELARGEPMYILDPWESESYEGWRTSEEHVHEFYFTRWKDSYAEAFGDRSARGVIAVAVYRERVPEKKSLSREGGAAAERSAPEPAASAVLSDAARNQPGTGFGGEIDSPVLRVAFDAQRSPAMKYFIKYEWRETLCRKGVIDCERDQRNRFWDDDGGRMGFAPFPPGK